MANVYYYLFKLSVAFLFTFNLAAQQLDSIAINQLDSVAQAPSIIEVQNPLEPTNTSSPRATIVNFIEYMDDSYSILMNANERNIEIPGFFVAEEVKSKVYQAELFFDRATYCMDLSGIPPSLRKDLAYGRAIMLKEILDRIVLPPIEEIPDAVAVDLDIESKKYPKLEYWRIPNSEIILVRTNKGILQGEYLFSAESIKNLPAYYEKIKHLPYNSDITVSKYFYSFYISTPGLLMPPRWSHYLPEWSTKMYFSQTLWQWIALVFSIIITLVLIKLLYSFLIDGNSRVSMAIKKWRKTIYYAIIILIIVFLNKFLNEQINLTDDVLVVTKIFLESVFWILLSVLSYNVLIAISEVIINAPKVTKIGIEATYTRATFLVLAIMVSIIVVIVGLSQIGVAIVPLLTGVGIGGIAIALAARSTLENIIASFTIFADKPYRVEDRVKVLDYSGTIESIGIRSTQIRLLSGPLVSIPNEKMATVEIENIQKRPYLRREFNITITYETSPELVEKSVQIIKDILAIPDNLNGNHHNNKVINNINYPPRVFFNKLNSDSLNIYIIYWYFPPVHWEFMKHSEDVNFEIFRRFNEASIDFAYPTQMLHLSEDSKTSIDVSDNPHESK